MSVGTSTAAVQPTAGSGVLFAGIPDLREARIEKPVPAIPISDPFEINTTAERLAAGNGGYEVVLSTPGLELGVYVLVAPEPDRQQPHEWDEVYFVLGGRGTLNVEGEEILVEEGQAVFVKAGAEHRFTGYEGLSLLVVFDKTPV